MSPRISFDEIATQNIAKLLAYAADKLYLADADKLYVENQLLDLFKLTEPYRGENKPFELYAVLDSLSDYAIRKKLCEESEKSLFETRIMGFLTPLPSQVIDLFDNIARFINTEAACNMLAKLSEDSAYIRRPDIDKNILWECERELGKIIVTINRSKPEKTPEEVKRAKEAKTGYPKCPLCAENCGFAGNAAMSARQTIRTIPFELDGEDWFLQFSPYVYFEQHIIAVSLEHRPMSVCAASFRRMLDFVDLFPHYFIGSNAALPIVGGSILAHDHYQGGKKVLPVFARGARRYFSSQEFPEVHISVVDWYNSIVRLESKNRKQLTAATEKFLNVWSGYTDKSVNIVSSTENNGEKIQHNAITPICAINPDGEYQFNLILRNNRTDQNHKFGIFHPAEELHNIKQESIGIIEVMGLFILPGRLSTEANEIRDILIGKTPLDFKSLADDKNNLHKHLGMIAQLVADNGTSMKEDAAADAVTEYINTACEKILDTTAVFKNTADGQDAFDKFINTVLVSK